MMSGILTLQSNMDLKHLAHGQIQASVISPLYNLSQGLQCTPETEKVKVVQISASRNTSHPCNANNSKRNPNFNADVAHTHCFLVFWHKN